MDVEKFVLENIDAMACELRPVEYISNLVRAALAQDRKEREIKHAEGFAESFYQMCFGREKEEAIEWLRNAVSSLVRYEAGKSDLSARLERLRKVIPIGRIEWHPNTGIVVCQGDIGYWVTTDACGHGFGTPDWDEAVDAALEEAGK